MMCLSQDWALARSNTPQSPNVSFLLFFLGLLKIIVTALSSEWLYDK
jgi:hypothetical protein